MFAPPQFSCYPLRTKFYTNMCHIFNLLNMRQTNKHSEQKSFDTWHKKLGCSQATEKLHGGNRLSIALIMQRKLSMVAQIIVKKIWKFTAEKWKEKDEMLSRSNDHISFFIHRCHSKHEVAKSVRFVLMKSKWRIQILCEQMSYCCHRWSFFSYCTVGKYELTHFMERLW